MRSARVITVYSLLSFSLKNGKAIYVLRLFILFMALVVINSGIEQFICFYYCVFFPVYLLISSEKLITPESRFGRREKRTEAG